jgi:hypothetical protein
MIQLAKTITFKKKVTRNEICFQNYNKFTTDSKQIKILILNNFALCQNWRSAKLLKIFFFYLFRICCKFIIILETNLISGDFFFLKVIVLANCKIV